MTTEMTVRNGVERVDRVHNEGPTAVYTFSDVEQMAKAIVDGGLFPQFKTPAQALSLMLLCQAKGLHPVVAVERYDLINLRPAIKTSYLLAEFKARGGRIAWDEEPTNHQVGGRFTAADGDSIYIVWTQERAQQAGLWNKENWQKTPQQMMRARCISEAIRAIAPECLHGLYTTDEVRDMPPLPEPRHEPKNVTPPPARVVAAPPPEDEEKARFVEEMQAARLEFEKAASGKGLVFEDNDEGKAFRWELINSLLERPENSRQKLSLADWRNATAKLIDQFVPDAAAPAPARNLGAESIASLATETAARIAAAQDATEDHSTPPGEFPLAPVFHGGMGDKAPEGFRGGDDGFGRDAFSDLPPALRDSSTLPLDDESPFEDEREAARAAATPNTYEQEKEANRRGKATRNG